MSGTMKRKKNVAWIDVQRRTFTGWTNNVLKNRGLKCESLTESFDDGILLINMYEILTGQPIKKRYNKKPKMNPQKLENLTIALEAFKEDGLKIVNIDSKDVMDGDDKLMLGLIWSLILKYQISGADGGDGSAKDALLRWVQQQVSPYNVEKPLNFKDSWADGKVLTALVDSLSPGLANPDECCGNPIADINDAMNKAENNFDIPMVLAPEDMNAAVDDLSCMTYVSYFKDYVEKNGIKDFSGADGSKSSAEGPGLTEARNNAPGVFTVFAKDKAGNPLRNGGDDVQIVVRNKDNNPVEVSVVDNGDGTYGVQYAAEHPGDYEIDVLVNGQHVPGSTFHVTVKPGAQPELMSGTFTYTVQAKDKDGDELTYGGDDWQVGIKGPNNSDVDVKAADNGDGTYSASYELFAVEGSDAVFEVSTTLNGTHVGSSPFKHRLGPKPSAFRRLANALQGLKGTQNGAGTKAASGGGGGGGVPGPSKSLPTPPGGGGGGGGARGKFCKECGAAYKNVASDKFCMECGTPR